MSRTLIGAVISFRPQISPEVHQQLFQPSVPLLELLQPPRVRHAHAIELPIPRVERRLRYAVLAAQLRRLIPASCSRRTPNDLLFGESASLHRSISLSSRGPYLYPEEVSGLWPPGQAPAGPADAPTVRLT